MNKIRSLTLVIGVKEDKITGILKLLNPETVYFKVFLASEPGRTIEDRFKLAAAVNLEAVNKIYPINEPQETISFRFPCLEANNTYKATTTPWSASDLSKEVRPFKFNCNCGSEIIYSERIKQWKSLPSENWAEMMDFWHCHKPNTGRNEYNKSYAVSRFVPYDGCIFVGLNYFLVSPKNCENIKINLKQVQCTNCSRILGDVEDDRTIRLWKWNLKLSEKEKYSVLKPSYCGYIYALSTVLEQIDAHATYIYNVECQGKSQHGNRYLVSYFSGIFLLVTMLFNAPSKVN